MARTATIPGVELVSVGTWAASTGVTTVTRADLEAMLAAHADGLVDHAPVKLGHESPLNNALGDGAPAYGWVVPKTIRKNAAGRDTLVGDLIGVPSALAAVVPTAYRRRSVEIAWQVETPAGKTYAAALIGVALLGATPPAVKGLDDVLALYSTTPDVDHVDELTVVEGLEENPVAVAMLTAARMAGAPIGQVDAMAAAAGARDTADVPPPVPTTENDDPQTTTGRGGPTMPRLTDEQLRTALGLEADADVNQALSGILAERNTGTEPQNPPADPPVEGTPQADPVQPAEDPNTDGTGAGTTDPNTGATVPATSATPELATLSAGTLAELQREAAWARSTRRNGILDNAIRSGRITPAERAAFAAQLDKDEAGTVTLLGAMAPRFPTTELGDDAAGDSPTALAAADQAFDQFEASVFPDLARARQTPTQA